MDKYKKIVLIVISIIIVVSVAVFIFLFLNKEKPIVEAPTTALSEKTETETETEKILRELAKNPESFTVIGKISKINDASIEFSSPSINNNEKFEILVISEDMLVFKKEKNDSEEIKYEFVLKKVEFADITLNQDVEAEFTITPDGSYKLSKIIII